MKTPRNVWAFLFAGALAVWALSTASLGQEYDADNAAPPVVAAVPEGAVLLSDEQLDELLASIALYPDSLLAQMLPARAYPLEAIVACQWLQTNPQVDDAVIEQQNWDQSVKAMAHYPTVLQTMCEHADWMQAVGAAFVNQQEAVMASIQRLRQRALEAQALENTPQQQVAVVGSTIEILPTNPEFIYVPIYDPIVVYVRGPERHHIGFGPACRIGGWLNNGCDWQHHWVSVGTGWHPGWNHQGNVWRRESRTPGAYAPITRHWAHDPVKPRPMLPQTLVHQIQERPRFGPSTHTPLTPAIHAKAFELPHVEKSVITHEEHKGSFPVIHTPSPSPGPLTIQSHTEVKQQVERFQHSSQGVTVHKNIPAPAPKTTTFTPPPKPVTFTPPPKPVTFTPPPKPVTFTPAPPPRSVTFTPPPPPRTVTHTPPPPPAFSGVTSGRDATDDSTRGRRSLRH